MPEAGIDKALPFALLASSGRDLTYLKFADLQAEVDEARVSGEPYRGGEKKYRAAVYGDRGVYRPGETAHLVAIVRDAEHVAPPAGMPVQVKLVDPRGKVIRQHTLPVNGAGRGDARSHLRRLRAHRPLRGAGGGRRQGGGQPRLPRRGVRARAHEGGGAPAGAALPARRGGAGRRRRPLPLRRRARRRQGRARLRAGAATFAPKQNANFVYGVWRDADKEPDKPVPLGAVAGELDAEGKATLACPGVPSAGSYRGPATIVARAAVFEAGSGRTTVGQASVPVHPARYYVGLQSSAKKVRAGGELVVQGVVVDWNGSLVPNDVKRSTSSWCASRRSTAGTTTRT